MRRPKPRILSPALRSRLQHRPSRSASCVASAPHPADPAIPPAISATEADIAAQERENEAEPIRDAARYARRIRRRPGLSQAELARRIDVPTDTIRNWEQGKRWPTGPARALLRVLDKAPEAALHALA